MIDQLLNNLSIASLCTTIFVCVLIIFRKVITNIVGARWNYYIWFIVVIPWITVWLPFTFSSELPLNIRFITHSIKIQSIAPDLSYSKIFILWIVGVFVYLALHLYKHFKFISALNKNSLELTITKQEIIKNCLKNLKLIPIQRIRLSREIQSPFICHIFNSRIYLPFNFFDIYTSSEQNYILQHECVHYHRCDLIANTALLLLICLNWFNPIILLSYRYFRAAQELSCDAIVSQQFSNSKKKEYGYALLKASYNEELDTTSTSCWWNSHKQLKERCKMLKFHQSKPIKNLMGLITLSILASIAIASPNLCKDNSEMKISNFSKNPLSFKVEDNCSDVLGRVDSHSVKALSKERILLACKNNRRHCKIYVYASSQCTEEPIATLIIDVTGWGVMSIAPPFSNFYHVGANGFNLFIEGPW